MTVASSVDLVTFPWLANSTTIKQGFHCVQTVTRLLKFFLLFFSVILLLNLQIQQQIYRHDYSCVLVLKLLKKMNVLKQCTFISRDYPTPSRLAWHSQRQSSFHNVFASCVFGVETMTKAIPANPPVYLVQDGIFQGNSILVVTLPTSSEWLYCVSIQMCAEEALSTSVSTALPKAPD